MEGTQRERRRLGRGSQPLAVDRPAVEVLGDEVAGSSRDERRRDPQPGGLVARQPLGVAVDSQQRGIACPSDAARSRGRRIGPGSCGW